jgi:hypothetical protein
MEGACDDKFGVKKIAYNVKSLRRLGRVIGQCEALTPAPNVPEKKRTTAAGRLRFFVGQAATAAQRKLYVICSALAFIIIYISYNNFFIRFKPIIFLFTIYF